MSLGVTTTRMVGQEEGRIGQAWLKLATCSVSSIRVNIELAKRPYVHSLKSAGLCTGATLASCILTAEVHHLCLGLCAASKRVGPFLKHQKLSQSERAQADRRDTTSQDPMQRLICPRADCHS